MAWIESHQSLATHRKTYAVARLLGVSRAQVIGHLHLLWWWALDNAPDGNISTIDPQDIARAADWQGEPSTLIGALTTVGFIDNPGRIHNWEEYAGRIEYHRLKNQEYQRRFREKQKQLLLPQNSKTDVSLTKFLCKANPTVPNRTQPNHTKEESKEETAADGAVFIAFENNITMLTPMIAEELKDLQKQYPEAWILDAIKESVGHNGRSLSYMKAILTRWQTQGRNSEKKSNEIVRKYKFD